jgi:hypothetical protein
MIGQYPQKSFSEYPYSFIIGAVIRMRDKDKEAYWKGRSDYEKHAETEEGEDVFHGIAELDSFYYQPPEEHEEAYREGRKRKRKRSFFYSSGWDDKDFYRGGWDDGYGREGGWLDAERYEEEMLEM